MKAIYRSRRQSRLDLKDRSLWIQVFPRPGPNNIRTKTDRRIGIKSLGQILFIPFLGSVSPQWRKGISFGGRQRQQDRNDRTESLHGVTPL